MMIQIAFIAAYLWSVAANPSAALDVVRQCEIHSDCDANHYCLLTYCERCIPCDQWFNRQPAQSLSGVPICARREDDCGICLSGYQAQDLTDQRRSMQCFPMDETVSRDPFPVLIITAAITFLFFVTIMLIARRRIRRRLNYQVKVLEPCATILTYSGRNRIPVDEEDSFIGTDLSETIIHRIQIHHKLDDPPTYEQAVSNFHHGRNSKVETYIPPMDSKDIHREFNAELNLSSESVSSTMEESMLIPGTSNHFVKNPSPDELHADNRIVNGNSDKSSIIQSVASSSEAQVIYAGVPEPDHLSRHSTDYTDL